MRKNIQFTVQKENINAINYIDIIINRKLKDLGNNTYRKLATASILITIGHDIQ